MSDFEKPMGVLEAEGASAIEKEFDAIKLTEREKHLAAIYSRGMLTVLIDGLRLGKQLDPTISETRVGEAVALLICKAIQYGNADFKARTCN